MTQRQYDPDFEAIIALLPTVTDFSTVEKVQEARNMQRYAAFGDGGPPPKRDDVESEDRNVAGPEGAPDVAVRIYRPRAAASGPRPCVFEIHGGGFMVGDLEMMDPWCERVCGELGAVVVSTNYRLAPEDPFPAGIEDCYAALCWTADNAGELGIDIERLAIAGQSAGGGLAAGCALMARDRDGPKLCFQLLEIPELDDRLATPSMEAFTDTPLWNLPNAEWSWRHYLGPNHTGEVSPYAAPARAKDLSGLPPAYISTMEFDPLRDEGIFYAMGLMQAGVSVELHSYPGTFHGSALMPGADATRRNANEVLAVLGRRLGA
ncbi:MAG: alpha/beta hydrolase [Myxococcota bacterium]|jgi:acetyl esterase/lipase|nr:alpha/beta hydrolase [Myxococcota bacterium]